MFGAECVDLKALSSSLSSPSKIGYAQLDFLRPHQPLNHIITTYTMSRLRKATRRLLRDSESEDEDDVGHVEVFDEQGEYF